MNEPMNGKNKECFGMQTRAPYDDGASKRGGDLYFKSGKSLMRSSKMVEKERSIVVMIIKNRF